MTPRSRRLLSERESMQALVAQQPEIFSFATEGEPPDQYVVELCAPGLSRGADGRPRVRSDHRFRAYLHLDYPRHAPLLTWETPIFHPNILPPSRNGGVCIGAWSPSENLADLCRRIERMVTYRHVALADALDLEAARWAADRAIDGGANLEELLART